MKVLLVLLSVFSFVFVQISIINTKEAAVRAICDEVKVLYTDTEITTVCQRFEGCDPNLDSITGYAPSCQLDFGRDSQCGCATNTSNVDLLTPIVTYAPGTDSSSYDISRFACFTTAIKVVYQQNRATDTSQVWQYIGSPTGAFSMWPGNSQLYMHPSETDDCKVPTTCPEYDPRIRPWYIAAASGPKDIVLLLDNGDASASTQNLLTIVKSVALSIIDGVGVYDRIAVVAFSDIVLESNSGNLVTGTDVNKEALTTFVNGLTAVGIKDVRAGFEAAIAVLKGRTVSASTCHSVILFISDGYTAGFTASADYLADLTYIYGEARDPLVEAKIFTFSIGNAPEVIFAKALACQNKGVWFPIADQVDLRAIMADYYNYFIYSNHTRGVSWSERYFDFSGLGYMTTAAMGCFSDNDVFFGVAGVDVLISEFTDDYDSVVRPMLFDRSNNCYDLERTEAQLEAIRTHHKCVPPPCGAAAAMSGSGHEKDLYAMRMFRDGVLKTGVIGRKFVEVYYSLSPGLISLMNRSVFVKYVVRSVVYPIIALLKIIY